jgi:hypothetical protein
VSAADVSAPALLVAAVCGAASVADGSSWVVLMVLSFE